jgi:hypothetical protein
MTVSLRLSDGTGFFVHMDLDELTHKLRSALDENQFVDVNTTSGGIRRVNPHHVVLLEVIFS